MPFFLISTGALRMPVFMKCNDSPAHVICKQRQTYLVSWLVAFENWFAYYLDYTFHGVIICTPFLLLHMPHTIILFILLGTYLFFLMTFSWSFNFPGFFFSFCCASSDLLQRMALFKLLQGSYAIFSCEPRYE